jgi:hypothetical protein
MVCGLGKEESEGSIEELSVFGADGDNWREVLLVCPGVRGLFAQQRLWE